MSENVKLCRDRRQLFTLKQKAKRPVASPMTALRQSAYQASAHVTRIWLAVLFHLHRPTVSDQLSSASRWLFALSQGSRRTRLFPDQRPSCTSNMFCNTDSVCHQSSSDRIIRTFPIGRIIRFARLFVCLSVCLFFWPVRAPDLKTQMRRKTKIGANVFSGM